MLNFEYQNPVRIVFGKGTIAELDKLVPADVSVLMLYGGGSIKKMAFIIRLSRRWAKGACWNFQASNPTRCTRPV